MSLSFCFPLSSWQIAFFWGGGEGRKGAGMERRRFSALNIREIGVPFTDENIFFPFPLPTALVFFFPGSRSRYQE